MKLGLAIYWQRQPLADVLAMIAAGERLGYDQLWVTNEKFSHDMFVTATLAARHTRRATIGTFVADPYSVHPALTAMAAATLDEVSGGRAILCFGAGGTGFPALGLRRRKPAQAIREAVLICRGLFKGETVDLEGEIVSFKGGKLAIDARADLPILVASRGDRVLEMAGEVADGTMIATYAEPIGIRHALAMVETGARRAGRALADLTLISRVDACIDADRAAAIRAVKPGIAVLLWSSYPDRNFVRRVGLEVPDELERIIAKRDYGLMEEAAALVPDSFVAKFCWAGTRVDVARQIADLAGTGIRGLTIMPVALPGRSPIETAGHFADIARSG